MRYKKPARSSPWWQRRLGALGEFFLVSADAITELACIIGATFAIGKVGA